MYPRLLFDLDNDRQLLNKLQYRAKEMDLPNEGEITEAVKRWEQWWQSREQDPLLKGRAKAEPKTTSSVSLQDT